MPPILPDRSIAGDSHEPTRFPEEPNNQGLPTFGQGYLDSITEVVSAGVVQAWDFYNNSADSHPWHFHLVNVQIVGRGIFATNPDSTPIFGSFTDLTGNPGRLTQPDPNERGWKETVRMNPGEVTRVIMRFDLPRLPKAMGDPKSPRTGGHEYVHHCHILEHEEHDMMRGLVVMESHAAPRSPRDRRRVATETERAALDAPERGIRRPAQ